MVAEGRATLEGSGQPQDPFILGVEADFDSVSNISFDTIANGIGSFADPWTIETRYAATSKLDHIPDVNAPTPTNAQVLSWDTATSRWIPRAPAVAGPGAVLHNTSLAGDGSAGSPLAVVASSARLLGTFPAGVGLSDEGLLGLVQHFSDLADRTATLPVPGLNALSMLDNKPGVIEYWNGLSWLVLPNQTTWRANGGEFLELSGSFVDGLPITVLVVQVSTTTDSAGSFEVLSATDLTGLSGVLAVNFQETGAIGWKAMVYPDVNRVLANALWLTDGTSVIGSPVTGMVQAICY